MRNGFLTQVAGFTGIRTWREKFSPVEADNTGQFCGLLDRDISNNPESGVHVLKRYNIENYYLDPLVVFSALLDAGKAPSIPGIDIEVGDEHLIKSLKANQLQQIADWIHNVIHSTITTQFPDFAESKNNKKEIEYVSGAKSGANLPVNPL